MKSRIAAALVATLSTGPALAADFYLDPDGSLDAAGTEVDPLGSVADVLDSGLLGTVIQPGDRLLLRAGLHGALSVEGGDFEPPIIIEGDGDGLAQVTSIRISGTTGLSVRGLTVSPSFGGRSGGDAIVEVDRGSSFVSVEDCLVYTEADASGWTARDWIGAANGIDVSGDDVTLSGNVVRNVRFGINVSGERDLIFGNVVDGFSADGMRGLGNYEVFEYNIIKNVYVDDDEDDNHDDGFQSWADGPDGVGSGEIVGIEFRGNLILNFEDPNQPLRSSLQGLGCFDGTYAEWIIENNVVITNHWHGITLLGARDSRIINNTVIQASDDGIGPPWISIDDHKDGTPPEGCVVRNNLATDYALAGSVTEDHNFTIRDPFDLFVGVANLDLRLQPGVDVIDQGSEELAPAFDADGIARPQGAGIDLGAYEWHEEGVMPTAPVPGLPSGNGGASAEPEPSASGGGEGPVRPGRGGSGSMEEPEPAAGADDDEPSAPAEDDDEGPTPGEPEDEPGEPDDDPGPAEPEDTADDDGASAADDDTGPSGRPPRGGSADGGALAPDAGPAASGDDGGCGCRLSPREIPSLPVALVGLLLLTVGARRRARRA